MHQGNVENVSIMTPRKNGESKIPDLWRSSHLNEIGQFANLV
jgi:hypothetical protein